MKGAVERTVDHSWLVGVDGDARLSALTAQSMSNAGSADCPLRFKGWTGTGIGASEGGVRGMRRSESQSVSQARDEIS
jgi:hypothetical protein